MRADENVQHAYNALCDAGVRLRPGLNNKFVQSYITNSGCGSSKV